jgi:DNA-binding NtrC family response regulator
MIPVVNLNQSKIVLLDADTSRRDFLKSTILKWGYIPFVFEKESNCLDNLASLNPDLVISGSCTSDNTLRFINSLKMIRLSLPVLLLADDISVQDHINTSGWTGVQVCQKNTSLNEFRCAVLKALDLMVDEESDVNRPLIVGMSPEVLRIKETIPKIGLSNEAVLIEGEPGTGKELVARIIHEHSDRRKNPFIKIDAITLPYQLLEGELFGYQNCRAAPLPRQNNGVLAAADNSTFFVREIGAVPSWLQAKFSWFLKNGFNTIDPKVGNNKNTVNVRIIASTTRNLSRLIKEGFFREDLLYRLNVLNIRIPPLRDRIADIPLLTDFFSYKFCCQLSKSNYQISSETISRFCQYNWPGNVKELEAVVAQIVQSGNEETVIAKLTQTGGENHSRRWQQGFNIIDKGNGLNEIIGFLKETETFALKSVRQKYKAAIEKNLVQKALESTGGNRKKAAEILEISYKSLLNKIKSFGTGEK